MSSKVKCKDCKTRYDCVCPNVDIDRCSSCDIKKISEQRNLYNRQLRRIIVDQRFKIRELKEKLKKKGAK